MSQRHASEILKIPRLTIQNKLSKTNTNQLFGQIVLTENEDRKQKLQKYDSCVRFPISYKFTRLTKNCKHIF